MNTADYLLENGNPDDLFLLGDRFRYSYHELQQACARLYGELAKVGVSTGERVAILGGNSLFWAAAYLAILKHSAVAVPFALTLTPDDAVGLQNLVHCKAMFIERRLRTKYGGALPADLDLIFEDCLDVPGPSEWPAPESALDLNQDAALMFTSGTTAQPHAVRVTHRNIQANTNSIIEYLELTSADRIMAVLPFYYCFGTSLLHTHLRVGGSLTLANSFVYPELVLDLMESAECTGFAGVPSTYQTLLRNSSFPRRELKTLRKLQQAGGKLQNVLIEELVTSVPQARVFIMYGQTEATARLSYLPPEMLATKLGSIGKGIPGVTLRVLDDNGCAVRPGEVGEIYATGDNISPGYLDDTEANAHKFMHGMLKTGDLATVDEDGYIYIVDRKADFIKSHGFRISSQQIESVILELKGVVATAVIGEPDLLRGEAIKAFVVLQEGTILTAEEIITHCGRRVANYMVPRDVVFINKLPLNAHGKVVKNELRNLSAG
ncbi:MAG TPA: AMP-binding protein [Longilinea sp.]|nr:AMP-binding protein [Longilinea sp.]